MPDDIRISLSFRHHRKRKKLFQRLGDKGIRSLIDFWSTVAEQNPTGILTDYSSEDIEIDAGWNGEPGDFIKNIIEIGFLDKINNGYSLHNWDIRQPWVFKSDERSDKARFSRMAKTHKKIFENLHRNGVRAISKKDYLAITSPQRVVNAALTKSNDTLTPAPEPEPEPDPDPTPSYKKICAKLIKKINELGQKKFRLVKTNFDFIIPRLKDGFTEADCLVVIDNKYLDPNFSMQYFKPETLFRKSKFEGYLNEDPKMYKKFGSKKIDGNNHFKGNVYVGTPREDIDWLDD